jgi:hypothetical protein
MDLKNQMKVMSTEGLLLRIVKIMIKYMICREEMMKSGGICWRIVGESWD